MSTYDDDDIDFDFFDEPETVETTQRRRLPRLDRADAAAAAAATERPPQPRRRRGAPTGLVPLARLVGLIAIAIAIVVGLVFWVGSCQGKSKHDAYARTPRRSARSQTADKALGTKFAHDADRR